MTIRNKIVRILAASTLMISVSASMAWANCGDDAPSGSGVPGLDHKYSSEIQKAKLQAPQSGKCIAKSDIADADASNEYFYTSNNDAVVNFLMEGEGNRAELRAEGQDFNIGDESSVTARLRIYDKSDDLDKVTLLQIHVDNDDQQGPLAALKWSDGNLDRIDSDEDATGLFLTVRQSMDCDTSEDDLCATNIFIDEDMDLTDYHTFVLGISEGELSLKIDGTVMSLTYEDIFNNSDGLATSDTVDLTGSDWDYNSRELYLKAGAYLNSEGSAHIQHRKIKFDYTLNN